MDKIIRIDFGLPEDAGSGRNPRNVIALANEARFTAAHFSEGLSAYAVGWRDPENVQATLDAMAPPVETPRRFEYKSATNIEEFLSEVDDVRAIGAAFKRMAYTGSSVNQKTLNKGLTITLDRDDMVAGSEERAVARLLARLNRNDLRRAVTALVAGATNTGKTWDASAGKDPDQDVIADLITSGDARGINPNVVVYGETAWQKRALSHRAQSSAGGFASASLTPEQLAQLLGVARVVLSRERYQSSASAKTKIVGSYVLMYFASLVPDTEDPSNVKQFWTPTESGRFRVYREEHVKTVEISVEHYSNIVVTSTLGIRMFTVS